MVKNKLALLKYFIKYCIFFLVALAVCLPLIFTTRNTLQNKLLNESSIYLNNGLITFENTISQMLQISSTISTQTDFLTVSNSSNDPKNAILSIKALNETLHQMSLLFEGPAFIFIMFENSDVFVSSVQSSYDINSYFGNMLNIKDENQQELSLQDFETQLFTGSSQVSANYFNDFSSYYDGTFNEKEEMVIFSVNLSPYSITQETNSYRICFAIPKEKLLNLFINPTLTEPCLFELHSQNNELVFSNAENSLFYQTNIVNTNKTYAFNGQNYWLLQDSTSYEDWFVTFGIPVNSINTQLNDIFQILYLYIALGFIIITILTFNLAYQQYNFFQRFTSIASGSEAPPKLRYNNEYQEVYNLIYDIKQNEKNFEAKTIELQHIKINSILSHYIINGAKSPLALKQFKDYISDSINTYCVVLMQINTEVQADYDYCVLCTTEYLNRYDLYPYTNFHAGTNRELFLMQIPENTPQHLTNIVNIFTKLCGVLRENNIASFNVGISEVSDNIIDAHKYYKQAHNVIKAATYNPTGDEVNVFTKEIALGAETYVTISYLERFHNILLSGNHSEVRDNFEHMQNYYHQHVLQFEVYKEQTYYSIQNVIFSVGLNFRSMELMYTILPRYSSYDNIDVVVDKFLQSSLMICDWVHETTENQNTLLIGEIEAFINENYSDCNLSAYSASQALNIPESKLQQAIKQKYARSFTLYLEKVRIEQAIFFLETTNMNNEEICMQTGFSAISTFYRVFNKWKGVSPGTWRTRQK